MTASPYGTRSRNRNGGARPNYAEDRDIDVDLYDHYSDRRDDDSKKTGTRQASFSNSAAQAAPRSGIGSSRKPLPPDDTKHHGASQHSTSTTKDQQSQAQAAPSAATGNTANGSTSTKSKKRKADASAAASGGSQAPSSPAANPSGAQKRQGGSGSNNASGSDGTASARDGGYADTNLLTFEKCKAVLKNGKMVADDGTVLEVNGEFPPRRCRSAGGGVLVQRKKGRVADIGCRSRLPGL